MPTTLGPKTINEYYAVYQLDQNVFEGTLVECAKYLGVQVRTAYAYSMPVYIERANKEAKNKKKKATVLVKLGE